MKVLAADVVGLMDALQIGAAHILCLSMGGMIAQESPYETLLNAACRLCHNA
jgi:hypothetical protein